jgi:hypothetical protein
MHPMLKRFAATATLLVSVVPFSLAQAEASIDDAGIRSASRGDPLHVGEPASASLLDSMRGGFEATGGLQVSFGIERSVYINGSLVTTTSLNVAESGVMTNVPSGTLVAGSSIALIQSGANNVFGAGPGTAANAAVVIQNSLDNQKIQGVTVINATVNSLALTRSANIQSSIQDALTGSIRR